MCPEMGDIAQAEIDSSIATHAADADAHHSEEVAEGRPYFNTTHRLIVPGVVFTGAARTAEWAANRILYWPIVVKTPITLDQLVIEVTTQAASGKKALLCIYKADTDWQPTDLVLTGIEVAIDAVAVVTGAYAETLQEGRYLLTFQCDAAVTLRYYDGMLPGTGLLVTLGATVLGYSFHVDKTYAAYTDPGTAWDTISALSTPFGYSVFCRVATP